MAPGNMFFPLPMEDDGFKVEKTLEVPYGRTPIIGDIIKVHYRGILEDGTVFDSTFERTLPMTFPLGDSRVVKGWN